MEQSTTSTRHEKPRHIMIGGFLGAGKTTAISKLARWLTDRELRVGLITNDQGSHLVDTTMLLARGFPVEEIAVGCFCCRFNSLVDAARRLTETTRPQIFIAEPVGSCTDLAATVTYPLRQLYGDGFTIAPLSVLIDPIRAMRVLGLTGGAAFSDRVVYIYRKQLEEADVIVINKCDLLHREPLESLRTVLGTTFPNARMFEVSARDGTGLERWFDHLLSSSQAPRGVMNVDYEVYADGEAQLGWLNCTLRIAGRQPLNGNQFIRDLAGEIQKNLNAAGAEIAHLKMTLDPESALGDLAVVNVVRNDLVPELGQSLQEAFQRGELTINLRAEAAPETLTAAVRSAVRSRTAADIRLSIEQQHFEVFRPGKPQPTHRVTDLV